MNSARTVRPFGGFTIVELLVVISIVVLLIAMLLPSLSGARESARNMFCQSVLRQTAAANASYTNDYDGWLIYNTYGGGSWNGQNYTKYWATDPDFLDRIGLSPEAVSNRWSTNPGTYGAGFPAGCQWPDKFDCPSQGDPKYWLQNDYWGHEIGVAYNRETHGAQSRVGSIIEPSSKFQFADGDNWWMSSWGSDYRRFFDLGVIDHGGWGGMLPRHPRAGLETANIAFFDAHVESLPKEETFFYGADADDQNRKRWVLEH
jgi:prepilin-type processing-associated H-X9-DG protein